jgi:hypothetical protein
MSMKQGMKIVIFIAGARETYSITRCGFFSMRIVRGGLMQNEHG